MHDANLGMFVDATRFDAFDVLRQSNDAVAVRALQVGFSHELDITLRPYGSFERLESEFGGFKIRNVDAAMITGGFVRRFMNADKNVMVSYYYDNNVNQYVKSIQKLPPSNGVNLGVKYGAGQPLVFAWIYRGKQSSY